MARGRPPAHTRDQVVDAAIRVADAEGLAAVTMRRIATEIGAGAMSLYTYVPDKDRLVDLMVDRVGGSVAPVAIAGDWRADLLALAAAQRALMLAHPWLPSALPNRRLTGGNMLRYLENGLVALRPTGLSGAVKMEVIALVTGFVAAYVTGELAGSVPEGEQVAVIGAALAGGDFPELATVMAAGGTGAAGGAGDVASAEARFERIAGWMIAGLVEQAMRA